MVHPDNIEDTIRRESRNGPVAVLARRGRPSNTRAALWQVAPLASADYAHHLYALLRRIDRAGCQRIIAESVPDLPEWVAIRDRLARASTVEVELPEVATGT